MPRRGSTVAALAVLALSAGASISTGSTGLAGSSGLPRPSDAFSSSVPAGTLPSALRDVSLEQRLGETVPLDLTFRDETGRVVRLGDYFDDRPVVLTLNYYECPMLCDLVLRGLVSSLRALSFSAGNEFEIVTVSIDPTETPELATTAKESLLRSYARMGAGEGWHFLTGDEEPIRRLAEAVGFGYRFDPESGEYAHAAGVMILTPDGRLSRYFYGVEYAPRDLRLGLVESSERRIGGLSERILLFCYRYDPATGKYGAVAIGAMRIGGFVTMLGLGAFLFFMLRRDTKRARRHAAGEA